MLNRILLPLSLVCFIVQAYAAENEQRVQSSITHVTVFINQAQVTRNARVNLGAGVTDLVFDKVSPFINVNSVQVKTEGNITLLAVTHRTDFLKPGDEPRAYTDVSDSLQNIRWMLESLGYRKQANQFEREVMTANKSIGGSQTGVKVEELEDALLLFRKRMSEINDESIRLQQQEKRLTEIRTRLERQLAEMKAGLNMNAPEILVTVKTLGPVSNARIELSYLVTQASWIPFYDLRVKDTKSPLQLVSKAYITQHTGEDWINVILKLSTSNPNEGGTKPELPVDYLSFSEPVSNSQDVVRMKSMRTRRADYATEEKAMAPSTGIATVVQGEVSIEFNVASAYTIPTDNHRHQVDLSVSNLNAGYAYGAVPKLDKDAFVTARVSGNDLVNQVSGEASVYFDGTYVGKTFINGTTSDTMLISLGRDKRIQIQRTKLKDFCSRSFTGSSRKELLTWEISLRNTRKEAITIVVEDQVPVTTNKDIEVKVQNAGGAQLDEATGKLTWTLKLEPEQSQSVRFSYEVKYPKDRLVNGL
jgi:uncharacterized protein (TIGR02231 family)